MIAQCLRSGNLGAQVSGLECEETMSKSARNPGGTAVPRIRRTPALPLAGAFVLALLAPARAEDLSDALAHAYRGNPTLQADRARQLATDEKVPQARSNWLPTISANGSWGYSTTATREQPTSSNRNPGYDAYNTNPYSYGVTLRQPIFRGFRTVNETRSAQATVAAGHEQLIDTEQTVLLNSIAAYIGVLRDERIVRHRRRSLSLVGKILSTTRAQHRNGVNTRTDVSQAQARYQSAKADYDAAVATLEATKAQYRQLIGQMPGKLTVPPAVTRLMPTSLTETQALAREANPRLRAAQYLEEAARHDTKATAGEFLPTVDLEVDYLHDRDVSRTYANDEKTNVLLRVNIPIFAKGIRHSRMREAKAAEMQRRYEARDAQAGVAAAAKTAWEQHQSAKRRVRMIKAQVASARAAAKGVKLEREIGDRTVLDELNAQQEIVSANVALEVARYELRITEYTLLASVGRLTAKALGLPTGLYNAMANTRRVDRKVFGISEPDLDRVMADAAPGPGEPTIITGSIGTSSTKKSHRIGGVPMPSVRPGANLTSGSAAPPRLDPATVGVAGMRGSVDPVITGSFGQADVKPLTKKQTAKVMATLIKERPGFRLFRFPD